MAKTPLGRLDPRAFGMLELPRLARAHNLAEAGDLVEVANEAIGVLANRVVAE